jgi:hypothetical protein
MSLLQRLQRDPEVLKEYDTVIKDQLNRGIVEIVDKKDVGEMGKVHYMPQSCGDKARQTNHKTENSI